MERSLTKDLCSWTVNLTLDDVPAEVQQQAKLIMLDGVGCGLVGARLPWSQIATRAALSFEPEGPCSVIGWPDRLSAQAAALLNSSFIQGFELDDWHCKAPLHSASLYLPALFAAIDQAGTTNGHNVSGETLLLAFIVGLETGPRIGACVGGADLLTRGFHSGPLFGTAAVALATSKLLGLSAQQTEWALGTACTQSCGLMSAQFGSMAKRLDTHDSPPIKSSQTKHTSRMQHGFASRNGLLATLLARGNYTGIENVLDQTYGGFISTYTGDASGEKIQEAKQYFQNLGSTWEIDNICIKPYPLMAGLHASVDCIKALQRSHPTDLPTPITPTISTNPPLHLLNSIKSIQISLGAAAYAHGGWQPDPHGTNQIEVTGAQMSAAYAVAVQLLDEEVVPASFTAAKLNRKELFDLIRRTECVHEKAFDGSLGTRVRITLNDEDGEDDAGSATQDEKDKGEKLIEHSVPAPRGVEPRLTDAAILDKWESGAGRLLAADRSEKIKRGALKLEQMEDVSEWLGLLSGDVGRIEL